MAVMVVMSPVTSLATSFSPDPRYSSGMTRRTAMPTRPAPKIDAKTIELTVIELIRLLPSHLHPHTTLPGSKLEWAYGSGQLLSKCRLLLRHRDLESLFRRDQMIVIIQPQVDLDPVDGAVELVAAWTVIRRDWGAF